MQAATIPSDLIGKAVWEHAAPISAEEVMDERCKLPRRRPLEAGSIALNYDSNVGCGVRNLSPIGACLEVARQKGIPDDFMLLVETDHLKPPCRVIWRTATRLGVVFTG